MKTMSNTAYTRARSRGAQRRAAVAACTMPKPKLSRAEQILKDKAAFRLHLFGYQATAYEMDLLKQMRKLSD